MNKIRSAIAAIAVASVMAACGSSDDGGTDGIASLGTATTTAGGDEATTPTSIDPEEAMLAYAECMREEGIDMPDPEFVGEGGGSGGVIAITADADDEGRRDGPGVDFDSEEFEAAQETCGPIMDEAIGDIEVDPERQAEMREQMLEYSQCMRDHGIDFPDPEFGPNGQVTMSMGSDDGPPSKAEQEAMQEASEECAADGALVPARPIGGRDD